MTGEDDPDVEVVWDGRGSLAPDDAGYTLRRTHPLIDAALRWGWGDRDRHHTHADRLGQAKAHQGPRPTGVDSSQGRA